MNGTWIEKIIFFIMVISAIAFGWFAFIKEANASEYEYNEGVKNCLQHFGYQWDAPVEERINNFDWNQASVCTNAIKRKIVAEKYAELQDFLKHNPRYRYPGQSNNRCWGKPRENAFESSYIKRTKNGFEAGVNYKDTLPAGCFETAPWDNRDAKN
jgi:hypothetical protein